MWTTYLTFISIRWRPQQRQKLHILISAVHVFLPPQRQHNPCQEWGVCECTGGREDWRGEVVLLDVAPGFTSPTFTWVAKKCRSITQTMGAPGCPPRPLWSTNISAAFRAEEGGWYFRPGGGFCCSSIPAPLQSIRLPIDTQACPSEGLALDS